ncbi:hypothetical protein SASPL_112202 [Salvia splendens]|uniref:L-2-hydroxyglutarate dehydrogenase, mitochondrial n=1 Tax=Salvia splendens TaxID=180675 RepID=A0A8X8YAB8_SALSN|nr:hypothetical protein SASPL_112202 [Salvia splendens]
MRLNSSIKIYSRLMSAVGKDGRICSSLESVAKETAEAVVIGAGVVGLAVARELAGREVLVVESAPTFGSGSSSRNSEVIHAANGLRMMDGHEAMRLEPELYCTNALLSPVSGIIDSHSFMLALLGEAESNGAIFSYNTTVIVGRYEGGHLQLYVCDSNSLRNWDRMSALKPDLILSPRIVVNSACLGALPLSKRIHGLDDRIVPTSYFARGCYFMLSNVKSPPFQHLIYPVPEDGGVGVHVTLDLNGQVKFGPNVKWIDGTDDISNFLNLDRKYYPHLNDGSLEPGYAGIRPKLNGPMQIPSDFIGEKIHGIQGMVNLFGIESPGLTASLAIAEHVAEIMNDSHKKW